MQLYVRDEVGSVTRPVRELRGFTRVALAPGETVRVTFELVVRALAFHDVALRRVVEPGEIAVLVGASSDDMRLTGRFSIIGGDTRGGSLRGVHHPGPDRAAGVAAVETGDQATNARSPRS